MNITMINSKKIDGLNKSQRKRLNITKISHENGVKCVEFFDNTGAHRGFSKKTNKALKKALKSFKNAHAA
jgi:hypothetical protein